MELHLNFGLAAIKATPKRIKKVSNYKSLETGVEGIVKLNEDGNYIVIANGKEYNLTKESLTTKYKVNLYVFNKKSYPNFITNYKLSKENTTIERGFPFMTVYPGLIIKGNLVSNILEKTEFNMTRNTEKIDPREHSVFRKNAISLIDKYNVKHNPDTTETE